MKNLRDAQEQLATNGGFSYSLHYGDLGGSPQYSISIAKELERVYDQLPTDDEIAEYVNTNITLLEKEYYFLGGWEHKGQYYLDVAQSLSKREYSREAAKQVGRERDQIAIFDLEYFEEIACADKDIKCHKCGEVNHLHDDENFCKNCLTLID